MIPNIIVEKYAWNPNVPLTPRPLSGVTAEVVHHSDGALTETVQEIHAQHIAQGWHGIGYNYVIYPDGSIHTGTPLNCVPAATEGFNTPSVAVCLIGDFEPGTDGYSGYPTEAQLVSLSALSVYLHQVIPTIAETIGHRDKCSTACPGQKMYDYLPQLRAHIEAMKVVKNG